MRFLKAVQKINPEFVIEEIIFVPGQHIDSAISAQKYKKPLKLSTVSQAPPKLVSKSTASPKKQSTLRKAKPSLSVPISTNGEVIKVEAHGRTATSGTIPEIPFGTYFLPYQAHTQKDITKTSTLILEPHSKAVVGNGGTAVSTPISKAFLKRGVPTNVYFSPESVAIAGVGGKAHAQADLELDLVDSDSRK
ncbi:PREDICTED: uncharacterized protein LOC108378527 [Rhagoletis zephyria]|uniref:uncharacterized protein LOC108378527 n=1 Tax=Rhagoletis zephyria TaxID=28612 RepID=UPI000811891C|nr:PREDICTED: uncharacterized protein LOC108378527 [Rhagoletis zephyria]